MIEQTIIKALRHVSYRSEFRIDNQIWHLVSGTDARRTAGGGRQVLVTNRHEGEMWLEWNTEVEVLPRE